VEVVTAYLDLHRMRHGGAADHTDHCRAGGQKRARSADDSSTPRRELASPRLRAGARSTGVRIWVNADRAGDYLRLTVSDRRRWDSPHTSSKALVSVTREPVCISSTKASSALP
jgi:hypothetical protein